MPPKFDPSVKVEVIVRTIGGEVGNVAALAPKVGPLGLPPKKVADDIAKATSAMKGIKCTCKLIVQNRQATVELVNTASSLVIKALAEPERDRKKVKNVKHSGSITMSDVVAIAKKMKDKSMAKDFPNTAKEILGTCVSVGCKVDGEDPRAVIAQINSGEIVPK
eukprot:EC721922.1.p2 GENE.EC721922.1~~EC721922.1.p2  ORF type:complete len:164 (+),score=57.60 EC721922.1:97-588(+)